MRSTKLQLLVTLAALATAVALLGALGLPPAESLFGAAARGDLLAVLRALRWVRDPSIRGPNRTTALHHAAQAGRESIVDLLIARGADVNAANASGCTPLHMAAWGSGQPRVARTLLAAGATLDSRDNDGRTPLNWAAYTGLKEIEDLLIAAGAGINACGHDGCTPLFEAVRGGNVELAEFLLARGAAIEAKGAGDRTPLLEALNKGHRRMIRLLIDHGADVHATDQQGWTSLHYAAHYQPEIARELLVRGLPVNARDNQGRTPLHYAIVRDSTDTADLLRNYGGTE